MRTTLAPQLGPGNVLVLATRAPPSADWRALPAWSSASRPLELRNLGFDESRALLLAHGLPPEAHPSALKFSHGHPLAIVADVLRQHPEQEFQPGSAPDFIRALIERLVGQRGSAERRAAVAALALSRALDKPLLAAMLATPDVNGMFEWLTGLSFITAGPRGLVPHALVREIIEANLVWSNRPLYETLLDRAHDYHAARMLRRPAGWTEIASDIYFP